MEDDIHIYEMVDNIADVGEELVDVIYCGRNIYKIFLVKVHLPNISRVYAALDSDEEDQPER